MKKYKKNFINDFNDYIPNNLIKIKQQLAFEKKEINEKPKLKFRYLYSTLVFSSLIIFICITIIFSNGIIKAPDQGNLDPFPNEVDPLKGKITGNFMYYAGDIKTINNFQLTNNISTSLYHATHKMLKDENSVYSPLSIFFAMSMIAQISNEDTQKEILNYLGVDNINELAQFNYELINHLSKKSNDYQVQINNSIWLNKSYHYSELDLTLLKLKYYASSFGVDFNNPLTNEFINNWFNDSTMGRYNKVNYHDDSSMLIANTVDFSSNWDFYFTEVKNYFHVNNELKLTKFISTSASLKLNYNNHYVSAKIPMQQGTNLILIMPNMEMTQFLENYKIGDITNQMKDSRERYITIEIPEFEIKNDYQLNNLFNDLGFTEIFTPESSSFQDFSSEKILVDNIIQEAHVKIDKYGNKATGYLVEHHSNIGASDLNEQVPIIFFNRPFIYVVSTAENIPVYIGVMNNPRI